MGVYTAHSDPIVDRTIQDHLDLIVAAVKSRMEPQSIILRGSFGRGEGSVMIQDGQLRFLSDCEIDVATPSPFYRSLFAKLSHRLTIELDMKTDLRWRRPDYMCTKRVGPLPMGPVDTTISLYESRYGSRTIYGQDIILSSPPVDPRQILLDSAIRLVLNRMAESLYYMPRANDTTLDDLEILYWVNKTTLACAESLLVMWGQYHYSYEERGRRFVAMANDRLGFMHDQGAILSELVGRATEFKLRPRYGLYQDTVQETWGQLIPICDTVFRHLVEQVMRFSFNHYAEFPVQFLESESDAFKSMSPLRFWSLKSLDGYRYLRRRRLPRGILLSFNVSQIVYAVVPLLFIGWASNSETLPAILREVRRWLELICPIELYDSDSSHEWNNLRQHMIWAWKNFCY